MQRGRFYVTNRVTPFKRLSAGAFALTLICAYFRFLTVCVTPSWVGVLTRVVVIGFRGYCAIAFTEGESIGPGISKSVNEIFVAAKVAYGNFSPKGGVQLLL